MKLIVGLGNPGIEYQFTPHNLGFLTVDRLADRLKVNISNRHCKAVTARAKIGDQDVLLAKPETFMNLSGMSVRELVAKYEVNPATDLIVVYDELDLPFGTARIKLRGGSAGHNGLESILGALGTDEFYRVRLGIAPEHPVRDGASYVLAQFKKSQYEAVDLLLDTAADAVTAIVTDGAQAAMNRFNRKVQDTEAGK
ncbi:MAG: aminoacyl-tRNA hydrolase [Terriglobales bacterium]